MGVNCLFDFIGYGVVGEEKFGCLVPWSCFKLLLEVLGLGIG